MYYDWKCPQCSADFQRHGEGKCKGANILGFFCFGLGCECGDLPGNRQAHDDHGIADTNVCEKAVCDHCGWKGRLPNLSKDLMDDIRFSEANTGIC